MTAAGDSDGAAVTEGDSTGMDADGSGEAIELALAEGLGAWLGSEGSSVGLGSAVGVAPGVSTAADGVAAELVATGLIAGVGLEAALGIGVAVGAADEQAATSRTANPVSGQPRMARVRGARRA